MKQNEHKLSEANIEPCRVVDSAGDISWDSEADIVVVGFGGAGVAASLEAAERGASVIAVDRFDGGGATAYSGGILYSGGGTPQQKEAGYEDTAENMRKYLELEHVPVRDETLRRFCDNSVSNLAWVAQHGVPLSSDLYSGKVTYPPEGKFLYYSGNEKAPAIAAQVPPAPRGHRVVGKGMTGKVYFAAMQKAAFDRGVKLIPHAPARRLVVDKSGAVIGIEIDQFPETAFAKHRSLYKKVSPYLPMNGERAEKAVRYCAQFEKEAGARRKLIRARRGVVLSSGGFVYNLSMLGKHRPELASSYGALMRTGGMGCDGSGIALGESVGGVTDLMSNAFVGRVLSPPEGFVTGVMVNKSGKRFINEDAYIGTVGNAIARQPANGTAWLILNKSTFWGGIKALLTIGRDLFILWSTPTLVNILFGGTKKAATLEKLAEKCGIDASGLVATVRDYDRLAAANQPDPVGKIASNIAPIGAGPYYAINVGINNRFAATSTFTLGGLKVDEDTGGVLRADGSIIPGLYAAGRTAVGMCSHAYMSGLSLSDTLFSGRRAAASAVGGGAKPKSDDVNAWADAARSIA
jgi:3-oxo-5alpha-steroid 4-dehydrogenase